MNKSLYLLVGLLIVGVLLYFLAPILTPFLFATLLAYLANPIVDKMTRSHLPRLLCVIIVFVFLYTILLLLLLLLVPSVQKQAQTLMQNIPTLLTWLQESVLPRITDYLGGSEDINLTTLKASLADNWSKAGGAAAWLATKIFKSGVTVVEWIANLVIIPVVTFYLLRDWPVILKKIHNLLPRSIEPACVKLVKECDEVLGAFFRGQFLVMLSLGAIYSVGLMLLGLQLGLIIGFIAGLVSIVPYLGFIVGIITASLAAYVQFNSWQAVCLVWLVFAVGQLLESTVLTPKLVGNRIGLHPVAVIFAVLTGGSLFGFFGVLLALPVAAVMMVGLRFANQSYRQSAFYKA